MACRSRFEGQSYIELFNKPPNSPDTNTLDLGFSNPIQSLQDRTTPKTVDELVGEVVGDFYAQNEDTLD